MKAAALLLLFVAVATAGPLAPCKLRTEKIKGDQYCACIDSNLFINRPGRVWPPTKWECIPNGCRGEGNKVIPIGTKTTHNGRKCTCADGPDPRISSDPLDDRAHWVC